MQESNYALSLQTDVDDLNNHPVLVYIGLHTDWISFDHWKDNDTAMYYCKIECDSELPGLSYSKTKCFSTFQQIDEFFINEIMSIYYRLLAS